MLERTLAAREQAIAYCSISNVPTTELAVGRSPSSADRLACNHVAPAAARRGASRTRNRVCEPEGELMTWTYHYDEEGVPDYPKAMPFDTRIKHYWTKNDIRIGCFGRGRYRTSFTYKAAGINVRFSMVRVSRDYCFLDGKDKYSGPICQFTIDDDLNVRLSANEIRNIYATIGDFLYAYINPFFPDEPLVEKVEERFAEVYLRRNALRVASG